MACPRTGSTSTWATCPGRAGRQRAVPAGAHRRCRRRTPLLREFAAHADAEADGAKGTRWSFTRDFGRTRLVMIDSRCGRILAEGRRSMVSDDEFAWIEKQLAETCDHLLIGTSMPWLLRPRPARPRGLGRAAVPSPTPSAGSRGSASGCAVRPTSSTGRRSATRSSASASCIAAVGSRADAPATICVLSGDVHHAYVAQAHFDRPVRSRVYQLTCSPLHNYVPMFMKVAFRVFWSRGAMSAYCGAARGGDEGACAPSVDLVPAGRPVLQQRSRRVRHDGRAPNTTLRRSRGTPDTAHLHEVARCS